ncbi:FMN-binding negative transcriptional regulator [Streptomyces sp. NPDC020681]|uniref:FMN-binding negative transcriptional regulator n=1 Tax=Streptomyces sp. NPDC020681 TaxID=3365083 RepID=UPI0037A914F7
MLEQKVFEIDDPCRIRELARKHPWATLASHTASRGLVVSHLPVLVDGACGDDGREELTLLGHLARTDAELHELGAHDAVLVLQGPHGYVSPSWYGASPHVPTWNFVVVHVHGRPEVLDDEDTFAVLSATVDRFEDELPDPWRLKEVDAYARRIAVATTGFRLRATRTVAKAKLSQNEPEQVARRVVRALESDQPYANRRLAEAMRNTWSTS